MGRKNLLRARINKQTEEFLSRGGRIEAVPSGVSGRDNPTQGIRPVFERSQTTRTELPEVVAAIENRKQAMRKGSSKKKLRSRQPRKKLIYDDFGEPLRWEWEK